LNRPITPLDELRQAAARPGIKAVSFDLFDTVITRDTGDPQSLFLRIGRRLRDAGLIDCSAEAFARYRYVCEKRVRRNKRGREVSLREVYGEMTCFTGLEDAALPMMKIEQDVERESISAIPAMRAVIDEVRETFGRVIFISDMYQDRSFLAEVLTGLGVLHEGDQLYVSSDYGVQKGGGRLFEIVLEAHGLAPHELLHCGNSQPYDVDPARRLGIPVVHFDRGNPHPSEQVLNDHAPYCEGYTAVLAGAARKARLAGLEHTGHQRAMWDTGASVTGPLVYLYTLWCLQRAKHHGLRKLYFLARDAYLPYLAARQIIAEHPDAFDIEVSYLLGSRQTYDALSIDRLGPEQWDQLTKHAEHQYTTPRMLQTSLMARRQTFQTLLEKLGLGGRGWDQPLTRGELERLRDHALRDAQSNQALFADIQRCQALQWRHFVEEGVDPGCPAALVDTGWTTRSHAPLYDFLKRRGCKTLRVFYFGLIVEQTSIPVTAVDTFMFNFATAQGAARRGLPYTRPMEELLATPFGRTEGFDEEDGKVVARQAPLEDEAFIEAYFETYHGGFQAFLRESRSLPLRDEACDDLRGVCERMIHRFWAEPTPAEARVWSQLTWEWDPLGQVTYPLARPYRLRDAWGAFRQRRAPVCYEQFWVAGAKQLSSRPVLGVLKAAILGRKTLDAALELVPQSIRHPLTRARRKVIRFRAVAVRSTYPSAIWESLCGLF